MGEHKAAMLLDACCGCPKAYLPQHACCHMVPHGQCHGECHARMVPLGQWYVHEVPHGQSHAHLKVVVIQAPHIYSVPGLHIVEIFGDQALVGRKSLFASFHDQLVFLEASHHLEKGNGLEGIYCACPLG